MRKLYPLKSLEKVKGKYKVSTLYPYGQEVWLGELNNGDYHVIIACVNKTIKIKIVETENELLYRRATSIAKINKLYAGLAYLTEPPNQCEIKLVLNMLEWEYKEDDIWC